MKVLSWYRDGVYYVTNTKTYLEAVYTESQVLKELPVKGLSDVGGHIVIDESVKSDIDKQKVKYRLLFPFVIHVVDGVLVYFNNWVDGAEYFGEVRLSDFCRYMSWDVSYDYGRVLRMHGTGYQGRGYDGFLQRNSENSIILKFDDKLEKVTPESIRQFVDKYFMFDVTEVTREDILDNVYLGLTYMNSEFRVNEDYISSYVIDNQERKDKYMRIVLALRKREGIDDPDDVFEHMVADRARKLLRHGTCKLDYDKVVYEEYRELANDESKRKRLVDGSIVYSIGDVFCILIHCNFHVEDASLIAVYVDSCSDGNKEFGMFLLKLLDGGASNYQWYRS